MYFPYTFHIFLIHTPHTRALHTDMHTSCTLTLHLTHTHLSPSLTGRHQHKLQILGNSVLIPFHQESAQYNPHLFVHIQIFLELWVGTALVLGEPTGHKHEVTFSSGRQTTRKTKRQVMLFRRGSLELWRAGKGKGAGGLKSPPASPAEGADVCPGGSWAAPQQSALPRDTQLACQLPRYYSHPHYRTVLTLEHKHAALTVAGRHEETALARCLSC